MRVQLTVNGVREQVDDVWALESLLFLLRERLGLRGSKSACEQGECGACSVLLDGQLVCACLVAAGQADGSEVITVEGLDGANGSIHPVQQAMLDAGGVQCGFCTPGMVMAIHSILLSDGPLDDLSVREALSGNLCRCTGYQKIFAAVQLAANRTASP